MARGVNCAKIVPLIEVVAVVGKGTEKDPVREITQYWDLDGELLFTSDDYKENGI